MKTVVIVATFLTLSVTAEANALRRQEYAGRERQALICVHSPWLYPCSS